VIYDGNVDMLQEEFGALLVALEDLYPKVMYEKDPNIMELFLPFVSCTSRFKHRGFFEESEVRAVLSPVSEEWRRRVKNENPEEYEKIADKKIKPVKFRHGFSPYIEIGCAEGERLPIERIIVGPSLVSENTKAKLQAFLELRGLKIEVSISETPLC